MVLGVSGGPGGEAELTLGSGVPPAGAAAGEDGLAREAGRRGGGAAAALVGSGRGPDLVRVRP